MPQDMGTCFSGSGSTFSPLPEDGLDFRSFLTNYKVFGTKANDLVVDALPPDEVPLDHLPEPKPPTVADRTTAPCADADRTIAPCADALARRLQNRWRWEGNPCILQGRGECG